jgi:phosphatidylserine/phosphatidylglycerophosphate/cardiolipin synthase-like enzyme
MTDALLICRWSGKAFHPLGAHARRAAETLTDGERVEIDMRRERSGASHRQFFVTIRDLWATLPERLADAPYATSPEALRKHALIATGWADVQTMDAGSAAAAQRVAAALSAVHRDYCVTQMRGPVVRCFTARSQSYRAMPRGEFQRSKDDALSWIEGLLAEAGA